MNRHWLSYFRANQSEPDEIPWDRAQAPPNEIAHFFIPSLQQFQLGEGASGVTFLELGRRHAVASADHDFIEALALFIAEEQRHSALLCRYLRSIGVPLIEKHWVDKMFRRIRKLAGLECMVTVLVIAEIMAVPYYAAVHRLSACPVLRAICVRILREEAQHLRFQASTLRSLQKRRSPLFIALTRTFQRALLLATCALLWAEHHQVLRAGGFTVTSFVAKCRGLLMNLQRDSSREKVFAPQLLPAQIHTRNLPRV